MQITCEWREKLTFVGAADKHSVVMDTKAPMGADQGASPKQLLLMSIAGCSAMDVVSLLKKYKQEIASLKIEATAEVSPGHPAVFTRVNLVYLISGDAEGEKASEAVRLSMTKYCSVSAMVSKAVPIYYQVKVNDLLVDESQANFV